MILSNRDYTTRDYRENEELVMRQLGLEPVPGSGCGWRHKGDGQSEHVLAELKSSEKESISIKWQDVRKLECQAKVVHKIPLFVINDLTRGNSYVMMNPEFLPAIAELLTEGTTEALKEVQWIGVDAGDEEARTITTNVVKSDPRARERARKKQEEAWNNKGRKRGFFD